MGRAHEKWHICKCLVFHAENLLKVYTQKNSGYTKSRRKIRQQKIPKIDSKFLHIELLSREAWASKDTRFLTLSRKGAVAILGHCLRSLSLSNKKANDGRLLAPTVSSPSSNDQSIQSTLSDRRQTVSSFHQEPS